jgi:glycosyltransferase involved in cell wall biosynthesis
MDYWQGSAPPVDVVPNGVSSDFFCQSEPGSNTLLPEYVVSLKPFILCAGNIFPYKNIQTLTSAFSRVAPKIPRKLVIIGRDFSGRKAIPADPRIARFDYVADDDLRAFYAAADMLVHPSRAEGFGLTVLEAMASGTPGCDFSRAFPSLRG